MYVGVDGCPKGWFLVAVGDDRHTAVYETFTGLARDYADAKRLLVDVPIGLPETRSRRCDVEARARLGPRSSSVFPAPCRSVLDAESHEAASARQREALGKGLSLQSWHLVPKIRDVDAVLRTRPDLPVRESHPELCFWALNDRTPLSHSKATTAGRIERLDVLDRYTDARGLYDDATGRYLRTHVARDDVLDALCLAVAATSPFIQVPSDPSTDAAGLPMEITFPASKPARL